MREKAFFALILCVTLIPGVSFGYVPDLDVCKCYNKDKWSCHTLDTKAAVYSAISKDFPSIDQFQFMDNIDHYVYKFAKTHQINDPSPKNPKLIEMLFGDTSNPRLLSEIKRCEEVNRGK